MERPKESKQPVNHSISFQITEESLLLYQQAAEKAGLPFSIVGKAGEMVGPLQVSPGFVRFKIGTLSIEERGRFWTVFNSITHKTTSNPAQKSP